jgi:hypothetical protein
VSIEGAAVGDQIPQDRERLRAPRFNRDCFPVLEAPHVELAGGCAALASVRDAIDDERAGPANAFAAV